MAIHGQDGTKLVEGDVFGVGGAQARVLVAGGGAFSLDEVFEPFEGLVAVVAGVPWEGDYVVAELISGDEPALGAVEVSTSAGGFGPMELAGVLRMSERRLLVLLRSD